MAKRVFVGLILLAGCSDDASEGDARLSGVSCAELSVAECGKYGSCQVLYEDGGQRCGEERIGVRSCDVMTVEECQQDARCQTIDGRPFDEDRECTGASEPKGCQHKGVSCPPAVIHARSSDLESYEFVSGCLPSGWQPFAPAKYPQQSWLSCDLKPGECEAHTAEQCVQDKRCLAIAGLRLDEVEQCLGESKILSCVEAPQICTEALVVARDPQGQRWWFGNGCLPTGFVTDTTEGPVNWPGCNPLPPPAPKACAELRGDDCEVERDDCVAIEALAYDDARKCVRGTKKVGCMPKTQGCTQAITYARDAEGQAWQFTSGCQPKGLTQLEPPAEAPQPSWPGCNP